jgi:glycosyltransferase involved in cell wall biosynthesis
MSVAADSSGSMSPERAPWAVMILAHNEERSIVRCLESLRTAEPGARFRVFVVANGCTDQTEALVSQYSETHPDVVLVSLQMPDKCNAWNVYIHETIPQHNVTGSVFFFMDGDCRACPGALSALARELELHPLALAAAALPATGRSMNRDRRGMLEERALVANLYALRGSFVEDLQRKGVRIPTRLEGDDGLIGALVKWNLDPRQSWDEARIVPCAAAGFEFDSMAWSSLADWRKYWRRRVRYGRRSYEFKLLGARLKSDGIESMPADIREIYGGAAKYSVRREGVQTLFNWLALREMKAQARSIGSAARLAARRSSEPRP